ncbi:helix-turn-helix domain-containing protein [Paenibacillus sp. FSL H8-0104]|uniref:helix-turn-helix domain-containing protein n=1 Tax=Paenibacillus sp. FSL H8-0104 TaxID=2954509 RepID=UPI00405496E6
MFTELLVQAQQHHDQEATLHILESFVPKIKASLRQVPADYRDDLKQELYVKMIEVIQTFDIRALK